MVEIDLTTGEAAQVRTQSTSAGDLQVLFQQLQEGLEGTSLKVSEESAKRVIAYEEEHADGVPQNVLRPIAAKLRAAMSS